MASNLITFRMADGDLRPSQEFWKSDDYVSRYELIRRTFFGRKGVYPRESMKMFQTGVVKVSDGVSIDTLRDMATSIFEDLRISCFQIAIYRKRREAHLLFDFFDFVKLQSVHLHKSNMLQVNAIVAAFLDVPSGMTGFDELLRPLLQQYYKADHHIFSRRLERLKHAGLTREEFEFENILHRYGAYICKQRRGGRRMT